jgi:YspA, cpYpsA-related SLOG family
VRVLVCGDRRWTTCPACGRNEEVHDTGCVEQRRHPGRDAVYRVLDALLGEHGPLAIIEGEAKGADQTAARWARERGQGLLPFPADWRRYGRGAGPVRNRQMIEEGRPQMVVAFHSDITNSRGTADMVRQAEKAGIPVTVVAA